MVDYSTYSKEELIAMLQARDAAPEDLQTMDIKIERLNSQKDQLLRRKQEIPNLGVLTEDEKQDLLLAIQDRIDKTVTEIAQVSDLRGKL